MAWFLVVWACLTAALAAATAVISTAVFRHLDLGYSAYVQLLVVPTVQALVVGWVGRRWSLRALARAIADALRHRVVAALLVLDVAVLGIDILGGWSASGVAGARVGPVLLWSMLKAAVAGAVLLATLLRAGGGRQRQLWLLALAAAMLVVAAEPMTGWLRAAPDLLRGLLPTALRWLVAYSSLVALGLIVLVGSAVAVRDANPVAGFLFECTAAVLFAAVLVVGLNVALHPFLTEPWVTLVAVLSLVDGSCACAGSLLVRSSVKRAAR
jgi:hypothetical protein